MAEHMRSESTSNPDFHVTNIRKMMKDLVDHIQQVEQKVHDPQAVALFETTREVLKGRMTASDHYGSKSEKAWNK